MHSVGVTGRHKQCVIHRKTSVTVGHSAFDGKAKSGVVSSWECCKMWRPEVIRNWVDKEMMNIEIERKVGDGLWDSRKEWMCKKVRVGGGSRSSGGEIVAESPSTRVSALSALLA